MCIVSRVPGAPVVLRVPGALGALGSLYECMNGATLSVMVEVMGEVHNNLDALYLRHR